MDEYLDDKGKVAFTDGKKDTIVNRVFKIIGHFGGYTVYEEFVVESAVTPVVTPECWDG